MKFREHVTAANQMRKAWKLIERNEALYPTFVLNRKLSGFLHTVVGAVPKEYHWLVDLAGMEGTIPQGVEELNTLLRMLQGSELEPYREEIFFYRGTSACRFIRATIRMKDCLSQLDPYVFWSPLLRYSTVSIRMRAGRNDDALQLLTRHYPDTFTYAFPFLTYKRGLAACANLTWERIRFPCFSEPVQRHELRSRRLAETGLDTVAQRRSGRLSAGDPNLQNHGRPIGR